MDVGRRSRADGQPRSTFEDLPDPRHLLVEPAVPAGGEQGERLDRQVDLAAGSALVLDPGGRPIDEQHRAILDLSADQNARRRGQDRAARVDGSRPHGPDEPIAGDQPSGFGLGQVPADPAHHPPPQMVRLMVSLTRAR